MLLLLVSGCFGRGDDENLPPPVDAPPPNVPGCVTNETRQQLEIAIDGIVLDFATQDPVAGVTVDVTTGWDVAGNVPRADCPLIATLTTDADGRFGPVTVNAGSTEFPPILLFLVHGGDRASTSFDARAACAIGDGTCNPLTVSIPAASAALDTAWRTELAAGGMVSAATRALVAFKYKNTDQTGAADVVPNVGNITPIRDLIRGTEVRFLAPDRATLLPVAQNATTDSGLALIGLDNGTGRVDLGGKRVTDQWLSVGCLESSGFTFFEDNTVDITSGAR